MCSTVVVRVCVGSGCEWPFCNTYPSGRLHIKAPLEPARRWTEIHQRTCSPFSTCCKPTWMLYLEPFGETVLWAQHFYWGDGPLCPAPRWLRPCRVSRRQIVQSELWRSNNTSVSSETRALVELWQCCSVLLRR